jgi:hypothetical protein
MPQSHIFDPPDPPQEQPACPKCRWPMWLVSIEPDRPDHDRRTFECSRCEHQETVVIKYD